MKTYALLALTILLLSSCATIFNTRTDVMKIVTNEPGKIIVDEDTLGKMSTEHYVLLKRQKYDVPIAIYNAEKYKYFEVKARNSAAYWGNLYPSYGIGFLIDMKNPKRYGYPRTIYVDMDQEKGYTTYLPLAAPYSNYSHILKFNPLKIVSPINAGAELSLEKRLSKSFTTQLSGTYLFANSLMDPMDDMDNEIKGFQAGIEPRYFISKSAPSGSYIAMEFSYLKSKYKDFDYFGDDNYYNDTIYTNYPDTFGVNKHTYTLNLKYGFQYVRKRMVIDLYIGMGVRYKEVAHFDRLKPEDPMEIPRHPNAYYIMNNEGNYFIVNFPMGVRFGWTF